MSTTHEDPRSELAAIAVELSRHLRWAQSRGEKDLPMASADAALPARPRQVEEEPRSGGEPALVPVPEAPSAAAVALRMGVEQPRATSDVLDAGAGASDPRAGRADRPPVPQPLAAIRAELGDCERCKLCSGRKQIVFGDGNPEAELVFVGEGPGFEEDQRGLPFVGPAGQLLDKMIEAMGYRREEVYIANVVKCRPPKNRNPEPDEVEACEPFLQAQLASIRPKVIVALGKFAAQTLLRDPTPITRLRGGWREYQGIPLMPTFHPAYLLRSPEEKGKAWADLQQVMARLGKSRPGK